MGTAIAMLVGANTAILFLLVTAAVLAGRKEKSK